MTADSITYSFGPHSIRFERKRVIAESFNSEEREIEFRLTAHYRIDQHSEQLALQLLETARRRWRS